MFVVAKGVVGVERRQGGVVRGLGFRERDSGIVVGLGPWAVIVVVVWEVIAGRVVVVGDLEHAVGKGGGCERRGEYAAPVIVWEGVHVCGGDEHDGCTLQVAARTKKKINGTRWG